jgi:hypothetical protein
MKIVAMAAREHVQYHNMEGMVEVASTTAPRMKMRYPLVDGVWTILEGLICTGDDGRYYVVSVSVFDNMLVQ